MEELTDQFLEGLTPAEIAEIVDQLDELDPDNALLAAGMLKLSAFNFSKVPEIKKKYNNLKVIDNRIKLKRKKQALSTEKHC